MRSRLTSILGALVFPADLEATIPEVSLPEYFSAALPLKFLTPAFTWRGLAGLFKSNPIIYDPILCLYVF